MHAIRSIVVGIAFAILIFSSAYHPAPRPVAAQSDATAAALQVIAAINAHRLEAGAVPLVRNPQLDDMARSQAEFVAAQNFAPPNYDFHKDARHEYPRQRALRFGWPTYGTNTAQIEVGENAGLGNLNYVMDFWTNSEKHRTAMENKEYREIGVGLVPHEYGYMYIIVFGARPNAFPVSFDPTTCLVYLSNEYHTAGNGTWIRWAETVQFKAADDTAFTEPIEWQTPMVLPATVTKEFQIVFSGSGQQVSQGVDLARDIAILPDTLPILQGTQAAPSCNNGANNSAVVSAPQTTTSATTPAPAASTTTNTSAATTTTSTTSAPGVTSGLNPGPANTVAANGYPVNQPEVYPPAAAVIAQVYVNPGVRLHCREYPTSGATSLALIPNSTQLLVLGLPGPRDQTGKVGYSAAPSIPVRDFSSVLSATISAAGVETGGMAMRDLWLNVEWWQQDGTRMGCWVNGGYITLYYRNKNINSVVEFLELVDVGTLNLTPYNVPGGLRFDN